MRNNDGGIMTTNTSTDELFEKVLEAISDQQASTNKEENNQTICLHYFGYLSKLPKKSSIPEDCLLCSKVVECIVSS